MSGAKGTKPRRHRGSAGDSRNQISSEILASAPGEPPSFGSNWVRFANLMFEQCPLLVRQVQVTASATTQPIASTSPCSKSRGPQLEVRDITYRMKLPPFQPSSGTEP